MDAAELSPEDRALVDYAQALSVSPSQDPAGRFSRLRAAGLSDAQILTATEIIGYFNFINRMAEGLGVELEPDFEP